MRGKLKIILIVAITIIVSIIIINFFSEDRHNRVNGEITIWCNNESKDYLDELGRSYTFNNKKAKINIVNLDSGNYFNNIIENINNRKIPNIILLNNSQLMDIIDEYKINVVDEGELLNTYKMNFSKNRLQQIEFNKNIKGVPLTSRPLVLYLREDILNKYGHTNEDINTWDDLINVGKDIYKKSNGKYKALNGTSEDYEDLKDLLLMQLMETERDKDEIIKDLNKELKNLKDNKIVTLNDNEGYFGRISSINGMRELEGLEVPCTWTANNPPSYIVGGNKFFVAEGENLVVLKEDSNEELVKSFLEYASNNTQIALKYSMEGKVFPSYSYTYKSKDIEKEVKNFKGKSPLVVMSNISEKAPLINDYPLYREIRKKVLN